MVLVDALLIGSGCGDGDGSSDDVGCESERMSVEAVGIGDGKLGVVLVFVVVGVEEGVCGPVV